MAQRMPKEAGKLSIPERQSELKEFVNQTLWEGSREVRLDGVRKILEYSMQEERERYLKAGWYRRCGERRGYASGYYTRNFLAGEGLIEGLRVPRTRDGKFRSWAIGRYSRRSGRIDELIRSMFLNGVSTRDVNEVLIKFVGAGVSPQTVSTLAAELDAEVQSFHRRALADTYVCMVLDAVILKSREFGKGKERAILTAVGITADGRSHS